MVLVPNLYTGIAPPTWPVAGTAAKLMLTTDNSTLTDDGKSDCQLIVQVQNAAGTWISNSPNITLTDGSGLGAFPTGTSITFIGGDSEDCVRNGLAAIEYRSYTAGTNHYRHLAGADLVIGDHHHKSCRGFHRHGGRASQ